MKWKVLIIVAAGILSAPAAFGQTTQPPAGAQSAPATQTAAQPVPKMKIGLLSYLALREGIQDLKVKYQKLQAEFAPRGTELDSMQSSIETKEKVLNENKNLTQAQAMKLASEVEVLKRDYQRKLEDSQELAKRRETEETQPVLEKISTFLETYCQKNGITQVFDIGRLQETGAALYAAPQANITDDFIKEYNKANPSGSAPASAPARPPASAPARPPATQPAGGPTKKP